MVMWCNWQTRQTQNLDVVGSNPTITINATVVELEYTLDLKSNGLVLTGSNPVSSIKTVTWKYLPVV